MRKKINMKQRKVYIDILNIAACFCVICMHCNGIVHTYSDSVTWRQSMIVETIAYWAVPVFFMMSGATLMSYSERYDTKTYLKKRFLRVGVPFVAWSIINLAWKCYVGRIEFKWSITYLASLIVNNKIENVYWFFMPLFAVYLSIPVLACIRENRSLLKYMLLCGGLTYSIFPVLGKMVGIPFNSSLSFPMTGGYVLYAILGYVLSTEDLSKRQRYIIYINAILCVLLRYFSTTMVSVRTGELYKEFWGYMNFPAVGLSVGVFVLFKYVKWDSIFSNPTRINIVTSVASASFGIYLIHMIVINTFYVYGVNVYGWKWRVIGPILVYFISLVAVKCIQRIPGIKRIIP